jgi:hypothetical protein
MNTELEDYKKQMLKGAQRRAILMGILVFIPMVASVYFYIRNDILTEQLRVKSSEVTALNIITQQTQQDALMSKKMLERANQETAKAREMAEACQKSKK